MGLFNRLLLIGVTLSAIFIAKYLLKSPPIPQLKDEWWGEGKFVTKDESIRPFKIQVPDQVLEDLSERLRKADRLTAPLEGIGFQYGFNTDFLKIIKEYWLNTYDWRKQEEYLNSFSHFKTNIMGLDIHFVRAKPNPEVAKRKKVLPLLLLHGWPGSFIEFTKIIPMLTSESEDCDFVFDVIAPSLPGYGFSDAARKPGLGPTEAGLIFHRLMQRIGYEKYYVQGGDWGALVGTVMATVLPKHVTGLHLNMMISSTPGSTILMWLGSLWPTFLMPADKVDLTYPLAEKYKHILQETGYMHIQATKPDTVGVALNDSPLGMAAYILEKFSTWTKKANRELPDGGLLEKFTMDELLNDIMIYWVTNSITSSMRFYSEAMSAKHFGYQIEMIPCEVPTGAAVFPEELFVMPELPTKLKYTNLINYKIMDRGGHFAAYEEPKLLADHVKEFVAQVEKL